MNQFLLTGHHRKLIERHIRIGLLLDQGRDLLPLLVQQSVWRLSNSRARRMICKGVYRAIPIPITRLHPLFPGIILTPRKLEDKTGTCDLHPTPFGFLDGLDDRSLEGSFNPLTSNRTDQPPFTLFFNSESSTDCSMMVCSRRSFSLARRSTFAVETIGLRDRRP